MALDAVSKRAKPQDTETQSFPERTITVFLCANCSRSPVAATSSTWCQSPVVPDFGWPWPVRQVVVPCTGRLQPEHVLKAFESGSDAVCVVACEEADCHYLEGSKRCARRVVFIRSILEEVGLPGERLMLFHLPGTAAEDMALGAGRTVDALAAADVGAQAAAIRDEVIEALRTLPPSPVREAPASETDYEEELEFSNDDN
jgi:F420-non-reducing hydrogenase iron-sulfur subunit